jgi:hypothetical protein
MLTCVLWFASGLQSHELCGETEAATQDDVLDEHVQECASCPLSLTPEMLPPHTPITLPPVLPSIPVPSLPTIMPTPLHIIACDDGIVQHAYRRGPTRQTLIFIGRTAAGLADVETTAGMMTVCVGCQLDDLRHLKERFPDISLHLAPAGLVQALGVACVPTIVELSPTDTQQEDAQ